MEDISINILLDVLKA